MTNRRGFLKQAGIVTAGAWLLPSFACKASSKSKDVGIQLWTVRDIIEKDPAGVLALIAKAGYTNVEPYGFSKEHQYWGTPTKDIKKILDDNGMISSSGHYGFNSYFDSGDTKDLYACIEACHILKSDFLTIPSLDDSAKKDAETCKKTAETMNKVGELCRKEGLKLAYHNHNTEFKPFGDTYGYEIFLKETDPKLVHFEMDLYWLVRAGKKPADLFKEFPGRFPMWHVKDMDKQNPDNNTEIGNGSIDFVPIFEASKESGMQHFFLEQEDNYKPDIAGSIKTSYDFIVKNLIPKLA